MADQDDSEKTEEPTFKRIQDARRKGNIAKSQKLTAGLRWQDFYLQS